MMSEPCPNYLETELEALLGDSGGIKVLDESILDGLWYWDLQNPENEYMSPTFWRTLGFDPAEKEHLAREWFDLIFEEDGQIAQVNAAKHMANPEFPYDQIVRYHKKDGDHVTIRCRGQAFFKDGKPHRMFGAHSIVQDSERTKIEAQVARMMDQSEDAIISWTNEGGVETWNTGAQHMYGLSEVDAMGKMPFDLTKAILPNNWDDIQNSIVVGENWVGEIEHDLGAGKKLVTLSRISRVIMEDGRTLYLKISRDVTEQRRASEQRDILMRELNHRVKNLFSVAQAVISFTSRGAQSTKEMTQMLRSRIGALAAAHTVSLDDGPTQPTDLRELVDAVLSPYSHGELGLTVSGPEVLLPSDAITPMGLIIHEFATNAIKHGAWKVGDGKVDLTWDRTDKDNFIRMEWVETPSAEQASSPSEDSEIKSSGGFGKLLLENSARQLSGEFKTLRNGSHFCNILTFRI